MKKKLVLCFALLCFALPQMAKADYADFAEVVCLPEINKLWVRFFRVETSENFNLEKHNIYSVGSEKLKKGIGCVIGGKNEEKKPSKKIEIRAYYNAKQYLCNKEQGAVDYQFLIDGTVVAQDAIDANCTVRSPLLSINDYELMYTYHPSFYKDSERVILCGYAPAYRCEKFSFDGYTDNKEKLSLISTSKEYSKDFIKHIIENF